MNKILILFLLVLSFDFSTQKNIEDMTDKELRTLGPFIFGLSYQKLLEYKRLKLNMKEKTNANQLISSMKSKYITIEQTFDKTKISQLTEVGIPQYAVDKFKAALDAKTAKGTSIRTEIFKSDFSVIVGLGAVKIEGNNATVSYYEVHTVASLIKILEPYITSHCSGALFWRKCRKELITRVRGYTIKEMDLIKKAIRERAEKDLTERIKVVESLKTVE